jgi:hypothetical protein
VLDEDWFCLIGWGRDRGDPTGIQPTNNMRGILILKKQTLAIIGFPGTQFRICLIFSYHLTLVLEMDKLLVAL